MYLSPYVVEPRARILRGYTTIITHFFLFRNKMKERFAFFLFSTPAFLHKTPPFRILCIRQTKPQDLYSYISPAAKHRRFFMNCCLSGNVTLWILIALLVLGSKDGMFCSNVFSGCGLPIIVALLYCLYKNGTLAAALTPRCNCNCGCGCGCN